MLSALEFHLDGTKEIVIAGPKGSDLETEVHGRYMPNAILLKTAEPEKDSELLPLLKGRDIIDGRPTVYVCEDQVCKRPATTVDELRSML
jgi:uncharacterized protein YyaL (SSP411 family)